MTRIISSSLLLILIAVSSCNKDCIKSNLGTLKASVPTVNGYVFDVIPIDIDENGTDELFVEMRRQGLNHAISVSVSNASSFSIATGSFVYKPILFGVPDPSYRAKSFQKGQRISSDLDFNNKVHYIYETHQAQIESLNYKENLGKEFYVAVKNNHGIGYIKFHLTNESEPLLTVCETKYRKRDKITAR